MRSEIETKYSAAQSELANYDHDLHVLSIRLHQAKLEQASAEKAYQSFADEIENWREQRDAQLLAREKQVSDIRIEKSIVDVQEKGANFSHLVRQGTESEQFSSASDTMSKRTLQEGMLQMKRLTQQESAASISACYNACVDRTQQFIEEEESMKQRIADCKKQKEALSKTLEMLKYGGDDSDSNADGEIKARTSKIER
jgi:chromosome segregation ATPase